MSQKKPTTNQQLDEMREMISNLQPGKVITIDRELQERNTTLMLMLYGAVAKYGIGMQSDVRLARDTAVMVTAQVPVLQVPANHSLQWEVSEDGKSVMLYIVLNENVSVEDQTDKSETSPAVEGLEATTKETPVPAPPPSSTYIPRYDGDGEIVNSPPAPPSAVDGDFRDESNDAEVQDFNNAIGDEFEDEIVVGIDDVPLDEDDGDDYDGY